MIFVVVNIEFKKILWGKKSQALGLQVTAVTFSPTLIWSVLYSILLFGTKTNSMFSSLLISD